MISTGNAYNKKSCNMRSGTLKPEALDNLSETLAKRASDSSAKALDAIGPEALYLKASSLLGVLEYRRCGRHRSLEKLR